MKARRSGADKNECILGEADLAFALGQWEAAAERYALAEPSSLSVDRRERYAASRLNSGSYSRALDIFLRLSDDLGGEAPSALNNVGVVLEAMDSLERAGEYFSRALELDSTYADAWYNLARVQAVRGEAGSRIAKLRKK